MIMLFVSFLRYTSWGGRVPQRPVEDVAFAVARFFQRGGSFQNYYMVLILLSYQWFSISLEPVSLLYSP